MTAAHTPGPWKIACDHGPNNTPTIRGPERAICEPYMPSDYATLSKEEAEANCRLIAAAPTLLAELRETAAWLDDRANVLVQLLADPAGWGRGQAATDKRQAIREEIARLQGRAFLIRQVIDSATTQGA